MLKFSRSKSHPIIHTIKPIESGLSIEGYRYIILVEILINIKKIQWCMLDLKPTTSRSEGPLSYPFSYHRI